MNAVERLRGEALGGGIGRAVAAPREHHFEALFPLREQVFNHLGWVLQVGVERDHGVAIRNEKARRQRSLFAKVTAQVNQSHITTRRRLLLQQGEGVIGAAVVDADDFELVMGEARQHRIKSGEQRMQRLGFVEHRNDQRHAFLVGWRASIGGKFGHVVSVAVHRVIATIVPCAWPPICRRRRRAITELQRGSDRSPRQAILQIHRAISRSRPLRFATPRRGPEDRVRNA